MNYFILTFWWQGKREMLKYGHYPELEEIYRDLKHFTGSPFTDYTLEEV